MQRAVSLDSFRATSLVVNRSYFHALGSFDYSQTAYLFARTTGLIMEIGHCQKDLILLPFTMESLWDIVIGRFTLVEKKGKKIKVGEKSEKKTK